MADATPEEIRKDRTAAYGDFARNMDMAGKSLEAILEQHWQKPLPGPISGKVVALFMCSIKILRQAHKHNDDNKVDLKNYYDIAEEMEGKDLISLKSQLPSCCDKPYFTLVKIDNSDSSCTYRCNNCGRVWLKK